MNKLFIFILTLSVFGVACNKDANIQDDSVDTGDLTLMQTDTFVLNTTTVKDEAVNGKNISEVLLGQTNDSKIGESKASFYTQLAITKNAYDLGENPVLDSIVLILSQTESYGELNSFYDLEVYELTSELLTDDTYTNDYVLNIDGTPLGSISNYKFSSGETTIRIPLSATLGNRFIDAFETTSMESTENFQDFFNGIFVTVSSISGDGLVSIDLDSDISEIELYYNSDTQIDSSYTYSIGTSEISVSQYIHDGSGSEAIMAINNEDEEYAFVTSMSNFKTKIEFPDLSNLENIIINEAELTIYQADYGSAESISFPEPDQMILFQNLEDESIGYLDGYSSSNYGPLGSKELVEVNGANTNEYTFQIAQYLQSLINGTADSESLYLFDVSSNEGNRIKVGGGANTTLPMKLNIVYTVKK